MNETAYPHLTVACVIERDGNFLMVEEESGGRQVLNQPAGHVEPGETLVEAAIRETREETGWLIRPQHLLGISQYRSPANGVTYVRVSFIAEAVEHDALARLDPDIVRALWIDYPSLLARRGGLRSPMVLHDVERYRSGERHDIRILAGFL